MRYQTAQDWQTAPHKRVVLFGMSGLGKTYLSNMLRAAGDWFHYSVDYRIGTRYMGELIADNAKAHAMQVPFLRDLLMSDSIYIASNITFDDLSPVSSYLGKPGNPDLGGLPFAQYQQRQEEFRQAEISALRDTPHFIQRADTLYGYPHFICDTGGSICEWVDPALGADDPLIKTLSDQTLLVWIKGTPAHTKELIRRFDKAPKPMAYAPDFLLTCWNEYLNKFSKVEAKVNPDEFIRWTYSRALEHRQPLYENMAQHGITVTAEEVSAIRTPADFDTLITTVLDRNA